jgi:hypothetical protein
MARRGDTKPLCQVAQASMTCIGVSLLPLSGDKSLVLCQHGRHSPGVVVPTWIERPYHPRDHRPWRDVRSQPGFMTPTDEGA